MAIVTGATVRTARGNRRLRADAHGNNVAVVCPKCGGYAVLLIARPNHRGSDRQHPAQCGGCRALVWMTSRVAAGVVVQVVTVAHR